MIILYFIIGILASIVGALPLGASNIAVINTTITQNAKQAFKIAIAAGIAEVVLSYYALHCNMIVRDFFERNLWIQVLIVVILMMVGSLLMFKKQSSKSSKKKTLFKSKYALGFLLGILNPPVLIYWLIAIGFINGNSFMLSLQSPLLVLFLFFTGFYIGKVLTLYAYSKFSSTIKHKISNINLIINKVTGILLITIGIAQAIKLSL